MRRPVALSHAEPGPCVVRLHTPSVFKHPLVCAVSRVATSLLYRVPEAIGTSQLFSTSTDSCLVRPDAVPGSLSSVSLVVGKGCSTLLIIAPAPQLRKMPVYSSISGLSGLPSMNNRHLASTSTTPALRALVPPSSRGLGWGPPGRCAVAYAPLPPRLRAEDRQRRGWCPSATGVDACREPATLLLEMFPPSSWPRLATAYHQIALARQSAAAAILD